jgi:proline racemase
VKFERWLTTIDAHTGGEAVRCVIGGIPNIPGKTMSEKRDFVSRNLDHLRTALCDEPRGHEAMFVLMMTPAVTNDAAFGVLFMMSPKEYPDMCGHGSIGVATIAVETGIVEVKEPVTEVVFDTPGGTVHARVNVENGKVKSTTIQNVPSFLYKTALIKIRSLGELPVDIAFGGNFYGIIEARDIGIKAEPDDIARAEDLLTQIKESINQQVDIRHPELDFINGLQMLIINDKPRNPKANILNIATLCHGKSMDRSPCGTGTSAKMATLWAKGQLGLRETYVTESIIGSLFYGELSKEVRVGNFKAVIPEITGRAFITGTHNFVIDQDDPFKYGFRL